VKCLAVVALTCALITSATASCAGSDEPTASVGHTPATIVALGDSQTAGAWLDHPDTDSWPAQLNELMCPAAACVANLGLGGQPLVTDIPSGVPPLLDHLDDQLALYPDATTAVVLIGQVDLVSSDDVGAIGAGYDELADRLRAAGFTSVVFVTLFPYDPDAYPNPEWLGQLDERRLALNEHLAGMIADDVELVDVEQALTLPGTTSLQPQFGIHDGNHPSPQGAKVIATAAASVLDS